MPSANPRVNAAGAYAHRNPHLRLDGRVEHADAVNRARTSGELVWHYTTLDTLGLILQSNALLATEVSFQNDIRETSTADLAFRAALEELTLEREYASFAREALRFLDDEDKWQPFTGTVSHELTRNARFILCASDDPDSLYAWRTYASGGIGCAIGLDPDVRLGVVDPEPNPVARSVRHWRQVVYQPAQTRRAAMRPLERLGDQWLKTRHADPSELGADSAFGLMFHYLTEARSDVRSRAKDPAFSDAHEQRVTVEHVSHRALLTTPSKMGPRPHVRLVASAQAK